MSVLDKENLDESDVRHIFERRAFFAKQLRTMPEGARLTRANIESHVRAIDDRLAKVDPAFIAQSYSLKGTQHGF